MRAFQVFCTALLLVCLGSNRPLAAASVGDSITIHEIRVTLLDARQMTRSEYERVNGGAADWNGGGVRFVFLVENRPGATQPAALGEVRVSVSGRLYNEVTNPTSSRPFAPDVVIREPRDFFAGGYGRTLLPNVPAAPRVPHTTVLEVFVRGAAIPEREPVVVELEQGETDTADVDGRLRALTPQEIMASWLTFRFVATPRA